MTISYKSNTSSCLNLINFLVITLTIVLNLKKCYAKQSIDNYDESGPNNITINSTNYTVKVILLKPSPKLLYINETFSNETNYNFQLFTSTTSGTNLNNSFVNITNLTNIVNSTNSSFPNKPPPSLPTATTSLPTTTTTIPQPNSLQRRVCYFANWALYRDLNPPLYPDNIDPSLCTHIHYAFAKIDPTTLALVPTEEHDMNWTEKSNMPLYIRLYGLKRRNMALKILLAVGGWSAKSLGFNLATRNAQNRSRFINQTIRLLREWNFDGVDLDWEFPGDRERDADVRSKENFNALVTEFRIAVNAEAEASGKRKLLITSAVAADPKKINNGYVVSNLCKQLDYVSVMTYDYHGTWDAATGLNSPLYGRGEVEYPNSTKPIENWKNANYSINYWISNGCPPEKINFGLAAYGRSFTLQNTTLNKVGAPVIKGGLAGAYTKEEGIYSYFEICEKINVENWKKYWDDKQQSVYATIDDQWVGYDNQRSIQLKVKWASSMQLGGTMLWTLDFDDYTGQFCNQGTFPIANAIKAVFDEFAPPVINTTLKIPSKNETEGQLTQNDGSNSVAPTASSTKHQNTTTHKPSVSIKPEIVNGVHVDPSLSVTGISASFNNKSLTSSSSITDPKKNSAIGCSKASYFLINLFYLVLSLFIV